MRVPCMVVYPRPPIASVSTHASATRKLKGALSHLTPPSYLRRRGIGVPQPGVVLHGFPVSLSTEGVDHRARRRESRCTPPGKTSRICPAAHFCLFCVMTPYYSEEIVYSRNDLDLEKENSVSVIFYRQKIFPDEWNNFMERINYKRETKVWGNEENVLQLRHCASLRGHTLSNSARCVAICLMLLLLVISLREASVGPADHRCEEGNHR